VEIHDFNCGLKVFRAECVKRLKIYGQLHRFMLVLIKQHGFKVGEVKVKHSPLVMSLLENICLKEK